MIKEFCGKINLNQKETVSLNFCLVCTGIRDLMVSCIHNVISSHKICNVILPDMQH